MTSVDTERQDVTAFYDVLALDYDVMTGFDKRFVQERPFFRMLVEKYQIRSALDAGCGTGFHSLLLAQMGVKVTAVDLSPKMISFVRKHVAQMGLHVKTAVSSFETLPLTVEGNFDAVVSLGNTLAHSASREDLLVSLRSFARVLHPGGILFVQNLNYDRILAEREKVQSVKESEEKTFIRYYDYDKDGIVFNILTVEKTTEGLRQHHRTIRLFPLRRRDLIAALESAGFTDVQVFGGISMMEFVEGDSKDLVILARRG